MAWEHRSRGRAYYYFRCRMLGRVRRMYMGKGPLAELAAQAVADRKAARLAEREVLRAEKLRLEPLERTMAALVDGCDDLLSATLTAAGYYRHYRGAWRRRHETRVKWAGPCESAGRQKRIEIERHRAERA
jgi:hypothetical protein